ncbi:ABC transporter substrate-binding protein [Siccirubricoccus sp. KC 17139]|uniref:ABC transporter substrate-binding protein n=1 Tax=Siccirubricoccus soli TaxID=2899147 RepID=A0ABT1D933_9PROT|nr:ABC transporter substrate-binding protein [Siccirubricoccus soli]MCO6418447.1 ABC transporter substrate-binding protein [Siccirubricoccus soli]MCP2684582.1 ABC transporter substrate-binding protein [Siccirubricoccus soli]
MGIIHDAGQNAAIGLPVTRRLALLGASARALAPYGLRAESRRGGTLTIALSSEPTALVSATTVVTPALSVSGKVTEGLLRYDFDLNPQPELATEWNVSPDGLRYVFRLRPGVKWHDGKDFTAADVAFSLLLLKQVHPRGRSTFANLTEVLTPDPLTAEVRLSRPAPYLIKALAGAEAPILPKHIYEGTDAASNPNNAAPIGTGPFIFKEWVRGSHVIYARNPNYWDAPKPYLDQLIIRFIPDAAARSAAFETGQVDLGYRTPVGLADVERLRHHPDLRFETKGNSYSFNVTKLEFNLDNEYFRHLKVRQAVAHAIDREFIARVAFFGNAVPCASPIAPGLREFHDPTPSPYPFDLAKAEKLLDEAGFRRGANRTRFRVPLDFNPVLDEARRLSDILRATLGRIGIAVDIRAQDTGSFVKRVYTDRDFAFTTNGLSNLFDPTVGVQRTYWSKNFIRGVPFSNCTHYANPEVDRVLEAAAVENDPARRVELFREFQRIVAAEVPDINIASPVFLTIYNKRVHDHSLTANGIEANLADAYVDA